MHSYVNKTSENVYQIAINSCHNKPFISCGDVHSVRLMKTFVTNAMTKETTGYTPIKWPFENHCKMKWLPSVNKAFIIIIIIIIT